jgi:hypothetical protein
MPIRKPQSTPSTVCLESIPAMPFQCARSFTSSGQGCRPSCIPGVGTVCVLPCCAGAVGPPLLPPPTSRLQADSMSVSNTSTTGPVKSQRVCFGTYLFIFCLHCFVISKNTRSIGLLSISQKPRRQEVASKATAGACVVCILFSS